MKKTNRNTKNTKRRLVMKKQNARKHKNMVMYGAESGAVVVMGKSQLVMRRLLAILLSMVFILTTVVVGINIFGRAQGSEDSDGYGMMETVDPETGMVLRKGYAQTAGQDTPDNPDDDVYSLRLEAYSTKDTTSKALKDNTPLDIVMVLDQSDSMATADVFTGEYSEITDTTTFSVDDATGKYIKVGDKYYKVKSRQGQYAYESAGNGPWTVNGGGDGTHYYYNEANDTYYLVKKGSGTLQYKRAYNEGTTLGDWILHSSTDWSTSSWAKKNAGDYFVYDSEKDDAFYIIIREAGHTGLSSSSRYYEDEFFYLPNHDPKITETNVSTYVKASSLSRAPSDYALDDYNNNEHISIPLINGGVSSTVARINRSGLADTGSVQSNNQSLTVPVYTHTTNVGYTHLYWDIDDSSHALGRSITIDPAVQTVYSDELFVKVNGYELYYEDENGTPVPLSNYGVKTTTEPAYTGTLYTRDDISRLEAQQLAANEFAEQIATEMGDRDYRIAVVGNANGGSIYSGDETADGAFVTESADIESAITALTADTNATNGTLTAGLTKTADVFMANPLDPADSRKRIVIVFGDQDTWESSDNNTVTTRTADAVLKDTYNASVYTIGLFNGGTTTAEQFMSELSSEYFSSAENPTSYKEMGGIYHYIANSDAFPDEAASIISTFGTVATATTQVSATEFVLDTATALLKDVIHDNFNLPTNPESNTTIKVATGSYVNDELQWGTPQSDNSISKTWEGKTLTVEGFDYDANYVSEDRTSGSGQKIIITIDGLTVNQRVRTESKSAKRIYFNTAASGIYKNGAEELVVNKFPRPFLDDETWLAPSGGTGRMSEDGVVVNKYLSPTENGTYDLTVEAYTTRTSTTTIEKVPTDFIVVADQSGSMDETDMPTGYRAVSGTKSLEEVASGKYYVLGDDGNYYRVYGTRNYMWRYYPANSLYVKDIIDRLGTSLGWFMGEEAASTNFQNQFYFRETKDGMVYYQPVTMTVEGKIGTYYIGFSYQNSDGETVRFNRDDTTYSTNGNSPWYHTITGSTWKSGFSWRSANAAVQLLYPQDYAYTFSELLNINTGMFVNYPMYDRHVGYNQLLYRDANGTEHILSATTGQNSYEFCNDSGHALTSQTGSEPTYSGLYEATGYQSRLDALKNALTEFAQAVADESHLGNQVVDNRIAIVGFSSDGYSNTEVLTKTDANLPSTNNGWQKATADSNKNEYYGKALVNATDGNVGTVNSKITAAINALTANGGTQPEDGLDMAYDILDKRSDKTYEVITDNNREVDRNTIVIYFTDGRPGDYPISNQYKEANEVVNSAKNIKAYPNPKGSHPSVFSIGVFGESDGNPLTYPAHQVSQKNAEYEYDLGWMETFDGYGYPSSVTGGYRWQYLNRNWRSGSPADYGSTASDTIFDYMSVVSSNYPNATKYMQVKGSNTAGEADMTGYSNYLAMLEGVRGTYIGNNDYYRMASNQDTLVAAFAQAVTMMNQTISSDQRLDAASVMQDVFNNTDFNVEEGYSIRATTVDGKMDNYGTVNFDESSEAPASGVVTSLKTVDGKQTMTVTGFDYLENFITYGYIDPSNNTEVPYHEGKKLVVTISNVVPTVTGNRFYSNISEDNKSSMFVNDRTVNDTDFPTPSISRHSYTLDVGNVNPNATFAVSMNILDSAGNVVSKDSSSLDDVIIVYPNGTRKLYSEVGPQEFLQVGNGQSFFLENLPTNYKVETEVISTDDAYRYYLTYDAETAAAEREMTKGEPISTEFSYADHIIHIRSERGTKQVAIREQTIGSYGNTSQEFGETITMEIPVIEGESTSGNTFTFPCTFNGTEYTAIFTKDNENSTSELIVAKLTGFEEAGAPAISGGELLMKHEDELVFTAVPTGNTIKVQEGDTHEHDVYYYYGQDDVSASGIKLKSSNGELLAGTHTFSFAPVDGTTAPSLSVTFVDGSITQINGDDVSADSVLTLADYQTMYCINDNLGDAMLDIDGTTVVFDTETDGDDMAYVATIKRQNNRPPVSVTVERNDMDILIINERGDIPIEGIFDSSHHNWIIIILAATFAIAVIGVGIFVIFRKRKRALEA